MDALLFEKRVAEFIVSILEEDGYNRRRAIAAEFQADAEAAKGEFTVCTADKPCSKCAPADPDSVAVRRGLIMGISQGRHITDSERSELRDAEAAKGGGCTIDTGLHSKRIDVPPGHSCVISPTQPPTPAEVKEGFSDLRAELKAKEVENLARELWDVRWKQKDGDWLCQDEVIKAGWCHLAAHVRRREADAVKGAGSNEFERGRQSRGCMKCGVTTYREVYWCSACMRKHYAAELSALREAHAKELEAAVRLHLIDLCRGTCVACYKAAAPTDSKYWEQTSDWDDQRYFFEPASHGPCFPARRLIAALDGGAM